MTSPYAANGTTRPGEDGSGGAASRLAAPKLAARKLAKPTGAISAVALAPLLVFVMTGLAATPWLRAFQVGGAAAYLAIAALAPVAIATVAGEQLRQPPAVTYGASLVGLVVFVVLLGGGDPVTAWHGLSQVPTRLLTETLPLSGGAELVIAPVVLTWICGAATTELWVRSVRSALGLLVPLAVFVLAYAATSSAPGRDAVAGPLLLGALTLAAVVRHNRVEAERGVVEAAEAGTPNGAGRSPTDTPSGGLRTAATGAAAGVALAAILGGAIPALPGMGNPGAPLHRTTPKLSTVLVDPVEEIASLRDSKPQSPARPLFTVTTNRPAPGYFGVATLDDYNGGTWTFDTTFGPSGGRIPPAAAGTPGSITDTSRPPVIQSFSFDPTYKLAMVPTLDRPLQVRNLAVDADAETGMILPARPVPPSGRFTAVSRTPAATLEAVPPVDGIGTVEGALDAVQAADTATPPGTASDLSAATRFLSNLSGQRAAPTLAFLQAAARAMASKERRIDPARPPATKKTSAKKTATKKTSAKATPIAIEGTSLAKVINAVAIAKAATPEQFATFFVMVARYLGVPARLVTGFRIPAVGGGAGIAPAGAHQVTNRDGWTWAEIPVAGLGWVVADPTPAATTAAVTPPPVESQAPPPTLPPHQANAVPKNQILGGHAVAKPIHLKLHQPGHHSATTEVLEGLAALVALILLAGPGLAAGRRWLRRHARRNQDPPAQTVGAWLDLLDGLDRYGMSTSDAATSTEVAEGAGHHFGPSVVAPIEELGALADRALFSVTEPPDASAAAHAWTLTEEVQHEVAGTLDRRQRTRALLGVGTTPRRPVTPRR